MIKRLSILCLLTGAAVVLSQSSMGASPEERSPSSFEQLTRTLLGESGAAAAEEIEMEGTLEVLVEDRHDGSRVLHFLDSESGTRYALHFAEDTPPLLSGTRVRVKGLRAGEAIAVESGARDFEEVRQQRTMASVAAGTFGVQRVAVLLVNFANDRSQPITVPAMTNVMSYVDQFYRETSYQQTSISADVYGWYTLPMNNSPCSTDLIRSNADLAASAAGVDLSQYGRRLYAFPSATACGWAGLASVGGSPSHAWINGLMSDYLVIDHELGHNQGLYHSHALRCPLGVVGGASCSSVEYGDVTDTMGQSYGHFNAFQKSRLGWLAYGVSPPLTTVVTSGAYTLDTYETSGTAPKALRIPRGTTGQSFYVELRRSIGEDHYIYRTGVFVHLVTESDPNSSYLLDMTQETPSFSDDSFLDVGRTFTDPATGISIKTNSVSATNASVNVNLTGTPPPTCTHVSPAVGVTNSASGSVGAGTKVTYTIAVTNRDVSPCTASTFVFGASAPSGWTLTWGSPSLSIAPGVSASTTLSVTSPTTAANGTSTITGSATNATAPSATAPFSATYVVSSPGGGGGGTGTFSDNFNRADNTSLGTPWTEVSGDLVIKGNTLKHALGVASHKAVVSTLSGATQTVSADFMSPNNNQGPVFGLILRYQNPTNYYVAYRQVGGSAVLRIAKVVNGTTTVLGSVSQGNPAVNVPFKLTARVSPTTISLDMNGVNRVNVNDTASPAGKVGIQINSNSTTVQYQADNFTASVQ